MLRAFSKRAGSLKVLTGTLSHARTRAQGGILLVKPQTRYFSVSREELLKPLDTFERRHIGVNSSAAKDMLSALGCQSYQDLIKQVVPETIRPADASKPHFFNSKKLSMEGLSESAALDELRTLAKKNKVFKSYIGQGYYGTLTPNVIMRNILENPTWYTAYTPYQSEVSQGRLEMLLNFQTMVKDLTKMDVSNCSLLDEATSCAEAMHVAVAEGRHKRMKFFVSEDLFLQSVAAIQTRAKPIGVEIVVGNEFDFVTKIKQDPEYAKDFCGVIVQYPNKLGQAKDYSDAFKVLDEHKIVATVATDLLSLALLKPPGEMGADIVVGSAQRLGVPMFFGGPHAGYMAVKEQYTRLMPGRLIGVSKDANGKPALRMALQTREQFIKREKATSNICTAQALLANIAAAYGIYHGAEGLTRIAQSIEYKTRLVEKIAVANFGYKSLNDKVAAFDTLTLNVPPGMNVDDILKRGYAKGINMTKHIVNGKPVLGMSLDETTTVEDVKTLLGVLGNGKSFDLSSFSSSPQEVANMRGGLKRSASSDFMTHPVFKSHHSETHLLRYLASLEAKDVTLRNSMISLGSCTMKLNATSELVPVSWPEFAQLHPFAPIEQTEGYTGMITELNELLSEITGFSRVSCQPNSGAAGEYAGLLTIRKYHEKKGQGHRNICLIPMSAHGTNPASAVMAGMKVVGVQNMKDGSIDIDDLKAKAEKYKKDLSCVMITYPSTYGVFERDVKKIIEIIKSNGGRVYMDGANMNAQLAICSPGEIGADVCHLNLHKTFAIPHGGGGPGVGAIGVNEELKEFLPSHPVVPIESRCKDPIGPVSAAPYGSAGILPISWMYIKMLGKKGLLASSQNAILNANYMAKKLSEDFDILFLNQNGKCAHEFIVDLRYLAQHGLGEGDVAKRLADYGFHAPTMSWPVGGTMMIEPTESESKEECDRFIAALKKIKHEIDDVISGKVPAEESVLKNAPHSIEVVTNDKLWNKINRRYTREEAAFPLAFVKNNKVWPSARVDNVFGDRNLVCSCPSVEETIQQQ